MPIKRQTIRSLACQNLQSGTVFIKDPDCAFHAGVPSGWIGMPHYALNGVWISPKGFNPDIVLSYGAHAYLPLGNAA